MRFVSYKVHLACWPVDAPVVIENIMKVAMCVPDRFGEVYVSRLPLTRNQPEIKIVSFGDKLTIDSIRLLLLASNADHLGIIAHVHESDDERIIDRAAVSATSIKAMNRAPKASRWDYGYYFPTFTYWVNYLTRRRVSYV